jgi:hypothetical protein
MLRSRSVTIIGYLEYTRGKEKSTDSTGVGHTKLIGDSILAVMMQALNIMLTYHSAYYISIRIQTRLYSVRPDTNTLLPLLLLLLITLSSPPCKDKLLLRLCSSDVPPVALLLLLMLLLSIAAVSSRIRSGGASLAASCSKSTSCSL